jgi:DNA-binding transcriptional MerR regulator
MSMESYTAGQAARILNLSRRVVVDYGERGLIVPDFQDSVGRGVRRVYSPSNLVQIRTAAELFATGMSREQVKLLFDRWRETARKRPNFARWFDPFNCPGVGVEWLVILDDEKWFVSWHGDGGIVLGNDASSSALPEQKLVPRSRKMRILNLTVLKQEVRSAMGG